MYTELLRVFLKYDWMEVTVNEYDGCSTAAMVYGSKGGCSNYTFIKPIKWFKRK